MPCYLFTYHGYGTWMPDRAQGYVKRNRGILAPDSAMAGRYRLAMAEEVVEFTSEIQLAILDVVLESREIQRFEVYFVSTEDTHVHLLVGWRDERSWLHMRSIIKSSISRHLNKVFGKREWTSEGGSRKRVKDRSHFDYLVGHYLPKHSGWKWSPERGRFR
jgi:hypothetical protein